MLVTGDFKALDELAFSSVDPDENTAVYAYNTDTGKELLINEIGNVKGKYLLPSGTYVLTIEVGTSGTFTLGKA